MKYCVLMNGTNFLLKVDNKIKKHGFYKWVEVEAKNPKEAELRAVETLRHDKTLIDLTKNKKTDPPSLYLKDITSNKKEVKGTGFVYYNEE